MLFAETHVVLLPLDDARDDELNLNECDGMTGTNDRVEGRTWILSDERRADLVSNNKSDESSEIQLL